MNKELLTIKEKPVVPENWDYNISVEKVKQIVYKWKNMTVELANELSMARDALSEVGNPNWNKSSNSKTWSDYCIEIGTVRQVANRWLSRWFETPQIEQPLKAIEGDYSVYVLDPPWPYGTKHDEESRRVASPYPEKSIEELKEWGIKNITNKANQDSAIWLWTTHQFLQDSFVLLKEWGYDYKITTVWDKQKLGMGSWLRCQAEFCLLAVRGDFHKYWHLTNERDVISSPRREHSRKPDEFYEMIKRLCPKAKIIDIFSREKREGIEQYGNETTKF